MTLKVHRRTIMKGVGALALSAPVLPAMAGAISQGRTLTASPGRHRLTTDVARADIDVWSYDGSVPGPLFRYTRGERLDITFHNDLPEPSAIHWHGLRPPNAMDGAAPLTQAPVPPGETFRYQFDLKDAGTYWYHTHFRAWNQQDRGLYGVLIVDETAPPEVDRDLTLVLDDWVITSDGELSDRFGDMHSAGHAGRLGNLSTVNNAVNPEIAVNAGERLRLRLVNVANAQIFALRFAGHDVRVVAEDGNPVPPYTPDGPIVLGPAQRLDLILDATGDPGSRHEIEGLTLVDEVTLGTIAYADVPGGSGLLGAKIAMLEVNERPRLKVEGAPRVPLVMEGGAMGGMRGARMNGRMMGMREMVRAGKVWAFNGVAGDMIEPLLRVKLGETAVVEMVNDTAFPHAMHLHGMHFQVLERDGRQVPRRSWRDTTLLPAGGRATIAFAGEAPGRWMMHCHMVEHQNAGMMTFVEVHDA